MKKAAIVLLFITVTMISQTTSVNPISDNCRQLIIVTIDNVNSFHGFLRMYEREDAESEWIPFYTGIVPVVIGKNGLAWGRGLHNLISEMTPVKKEGDGKSPAGVFTLGSAFGYAPSDSMKHLQIPYIHVNDMLECVDDPLSDHYNMLVYSDEVDSVDWNSSEEMSTYGIYYEQGVVVNQNVDPIEKGSGSCIFLHNWKSPDKPMAGCTAMNPVNLRLLIGWLDEAKHPLLVQLTEEWYELYKEKWMLP